MNDNRQSFRKFIEDHRSVFENQPKRFCFAFGTRRWTFKLQPIDLLKTAYLFAKKLKRNVFAGSVNSFQTDIIGVSPHLGVTFFTGYEGDSVNICGDGTASINSHDSFEETVAVWLPAIVRQDGTTVSVSLVEIFGLTLFKSSASWTLGFRVDTEAAATRSHCFSSERGAIIFSDYKKDYVDLYEIKVTPGGRVTLESTQCSLPTQLLVDLFTEYMFQFAVNPENRFVKTQ